jgi:hypothetical protein
MEAATVRISLARAHAETPQPLRGAAKSSECSRCNVLLPKTNIPSKSLDFAVLYRFAGEIAWEITASEFG